MIGGDAHTASRREAAAAWLALTAPGTLLTCAIVTLAVISMPWVAAQLYVPAIIRTAAATLLVIHVIATVLAVRNRGHWTHVLPFFGLLAIDALLCGVLIGSGSQWQRPALPVAAAIGAMSLETGGWRAVLVSLFAAGLGAGLATWCGAAVTPQVPRTVSFSTMLSADTWPQGATAASTALSSPTALSVESVFAGVRSITGSAFPTFLSVETFFPGMPALASPAALFMPTLVVVLLALCVGLGASVLRVRRATSALTTVHAMAGSVAS